MQLVRAADAWSFQTYGKSATRLGSISNLGETNRRISKSSNTTRMADSKNTSGGPPPGSDECQTLITALKEQGLLNADKLKLTHDDLDEIIDNNKMDDLQKIGNPFSCNLVEDEHGMAGAGMKDEPSEDDGFGMEQEHVGDDCENIFDLNHRAACEKCIGKPSSCIFDFLADMADMDGMGDMMPQMMPEENQDFENFFDFGGMTQPPMMGGAVGAAPTALKKISRACSIS